MIQFYVLVASVSTLISILIGYEKNTYAFLVVLAGGVLIGYRFFFHIEYKILTLILTVSILVGIHYHVQHYTQKENEIYYAGFIFKETKDVEITGIIEVFPNYRYTNNQYVLSIKDMNTKILLYTQSFEKFEYLDEISIRSSIQDVREQDKQWHGYYKKLGVQYISWNAEVLQYTSFDPKTINEKVFKILFQGKTFVRNKSMEIFSSHTSALVLGMLLGEKDELSKEEKEIFNRANLSHILVVSGYNISLVISFVFVMLRSFNRYIRSFWALIFIFFFVLLVGAEASVVRAACMGCLIVFSKLLHRQSSGIHALVLAATCMMLFDPSILFDAGFHLSFIATYSLFALPYIQKIPELILTTVGVTVGVSVYLLYMSGTLSFVGIITNILVLGLIPFYMGISFVSLLLASFNIWIGVDIVIVESLSRYVFFVASSAQHAPYLQYNISPHVCVGIYVLVLSAISFLKNRYTTKEFIEKHYQKFVPQRPS